MLSSTYMHLRPPACTSQHPKVLRATFLALNHDVRARFRKSGSTATIAVHVGFHLVTASVGDTWAFVDTGKSVTRVSGNDRLEDSPEEVVRLRS